MRPRRPVGPRSKVEQAADRSSALRDLPPPPGLSPLRLRLLRLAVDGKNRPDPGRLAALRGLTLREALELEAVSDHRARQALILQDELAPDTPVGGRRGTGGR